MSVAITADTLAPSVRRAKDEGTTKKAKVTRVQLDLPPKTMERLTSLKERTEAASYAEVFRNALRLYEAMLEETENGREFLVRDPSGTISPYRLFVKA